MYTHSFIHQQEQKCNKCIHHKATSMWLNWQINCLLPTLSEQHPEHSLFYRSINFSHPCNNIDLTSHTATGPYTTLHFSTLNTPRPLAKLLKLISVTVSIQPKLAMLLMLRYKKYSIQVQIEMYDTTISENFYNINSEYLCANINPRLGTYEESQVFEEDYSTDQSSLLSSILSS